MLKNKLFILLFLSLFLTQVQAQEKKRDTIKSKELLKQIGKSWWRYK